MRSSSVVHSPRESWIKRTSSTTDIDVRGQQHEDIMAIFLPGIILCTECQNTYATNDAAASQTTTNYDDSPTSSQWPLAKAQPACAGALFGLQHYAARKDSSTAMRTARDPTQRKASCVIFTQAMKTAQHHEKQKVKLCAFLRALRNAVR